MIQATLYSSSGRIQIDLEPLLPTFNLAQLQEFISGEEKSLKHLLELLRRSPAAEQRDFASSAKECHIIINDFNTQQVSNWIREYHPEIFKDADYADARSVKNQAAYDYALRRASECTSDPRELETHRSAFS